MSFLKNVIKKIKKLFFITGIVQVILYSILRLLFFTYRLRIIYNSGIKPQEHGVFYFWHQHIIAAMFFFFKSATQGTCIVSPSSDGKIAGFICKKLGFNVIYGSKYKSSLSMLRQALQSLENGQSLCLVGDGSRGPAYTLQQGITYLAQKTALPLTFIDCTLSAAFTMHKSWDKFKIPLPFSTITINIYDQNAIKNNFCNIL